MRVWLAMATLLACSLYAGSAPAQNEADSSDSAESAASDQLEADNSRITLEAVLGSFAEMNGFSASFTEKKEMELLAKPLTSTGTLHYAAPDKLVRRTDPPKESTVLIDGDTLSFAEGNQAQDSIDLNEKPVVRQFVDGFRHVLAGDTNALRKDYSVDFEANGSLWTLTLTPTGDKARKLVKSVVVKGQGSKLETLIVRETIGDVTTTTFSNVQRDRTFTSTEMERLFSLSKE